MTIKLNKLSAVLLSLVVYFSLPLPPWSESWSPHRQYRNCWSFTPLWIPCLNFYL